MAQNLKTEWASAWFTETFKINTYICGTLPREATVFIAELQAVKAAGSHIETSNELRWAIFSDSQASIQTLTNKIEKFHS